ncbi:proteinase inhibitor type-2 TR8-like [Lycium barbarum]|uniref:proteinase inhibitor type-2 TR8-like n=1 Tax=Lycium barbarum TaxID=112863 RepID=UPI00293E5235|nr:proteinase inhibitor type-2 TR8-like [Lycium barbarum]
MDVYKVSYLVLLLVFGIILLVSNVEQVEAETCSKKCDERIYYEICPGVIRDICINCCEGKLGCAYFSGSGDLVCKGSKTDTSKAEDDKLEGCNYISELETVRCMEPDAVQKFTRLLYQ